MNYFSSKFLLLLQSLEELMFAAFVIGWYLASSMDSLYSMSSGTGLCISCSPRYLVCDVLNPLLYRSRVVVHPTSCLSIPWCVGVGSVLDPSCMFLQEACFGFSSTHKEGNPLYLWLRHNQSHNQWQDGEAAPVLALEWPAFCGCLGSGPFCSWTSPIYSVGIELVPVIFSECKWTSLPYFYLLYTIWSSGQCLGSVFLLRQALHELSRSSESSVPKAGLPPCFSITDFNSLTAEAQVLRSKGLLNSVCILES